MTDTLVILLGLVLTLSGLAYPAFLLFGTNRSGYYNKSGEVGTTPERHKANVQLLRISLLLMVAGLVIISSRVGG